MATGDEWKQENTVENVLEFATDWGKGLTVLLYRAFCSLSPILGDKMDDLRARISFQRDIRDCNIICMTETWLTPSVPDTAVTPSDNFFLRMDRTAKAGKSKGGGVCFMINKEWCDPRNISSLSRSCSPHLEHLSIICRPFYLPREFSSIIVTAVYIPPQADTGLALSKLHDVLSGYINKHPDSAFIIAGDFNKANLRQVMPNFHQHVSCPTRGPNTLDHWYSQFKNAYKARSLPAFGKSDHAAIFLTPEYKQRLAQEPPGEESSDALVLPLRSYATGGSWWRRLGHVPGEFIWRQRVHGCSIKLCKHTNRASYRKNDCKDLSKSETVGGHNNPCCG